MFRECVGRCSGRWARNVVACHWLGLSLIPALALAQAIPDAGSILRDTQQNLKPPSMPLRPPLLLPDEEAPPAAGYRLFVRGFRFSGVTLFAESELQALLVDYVGRELGFAELQKAALKISEHYREKGYFARALLPRQTVNDGIVEILVLEGRLGAVQIEQAPGSRLDKEVARAMLLGQQRLGDFLRPEDAQRGMRLINELPGVQAQATLVPGKRQGESELIIKTEDGPLLTGTGMFDNQGVKATGVGRAIANLAVNNPGGQGDQFTLLGLAGERNSYLRAGYSFRVGYGGLQLGANVSQLDYRLDNSFAAGSDGLAATQGLTLRYPLLRETAGNLHGSINFDRKHLISNLAGVNSSDKHAEVWNIGLAGDRLDTLLGGGINQFNLGLSLGTVRPENPGEIAADVAGPQAAGHFAKLVVGLSRLQKLNDAYSLMLNLAVQSAGKNLDSSEKFSLGGANAIRAYPVSEATGDEGWLFNAELRRNVDEDLQLIAFIDVGGITVNRRPWAGWNAGTPDKANRYELAGAGVALSYSRRNDYLARATLAAPIGNNRGRDARGHDSDGRSDSCRGWIQLVKYF